MSPPSRRRLKVFQAQFGFFDTVVAAPSQAAALEAWGTRQNLFASGEARPTTEPAAVAAALAHPGTPLKRAVGSQDAFELEAAHLPAVPDAPRRPKPPSVAKARAQAAKVSAAPPDRSRLNAAEAALHQLEEDRRREEAELRRRQDDLDQARSAAQGRYAEARALAASALAKARAEFEATGGRR